MPKIDDLTFRFLSDVDAGRLKPGDRNHYERILRWADGAEVFSINRYAKDCNVSRTKIQDIIARLEDCGYLTLRPVEVAGPNGGVNKLGYHVETQAQ